MTAKNANNLAQHHAPTDELAANAVAQLAAKYEARLDALEISRSAIGGLITWITWGGGAFAVGLSCLAWWFGHSYSEATANAQKAASSAFEREFFRNAENAKDFNLLRKKYEQAITDLEKVEADLKGFVALRDLVGKVEEFDPLELYLALSAEIQQREAQTRNYSLNSKDNKISETIYDPAFRQRAAFVFQRLLKAVNKDTEKGKPRVDVVTLFNAAANASKIDMDFVALELMEVAVAQDKSKAPDNEARLIRQRLGMSRISKEEALKALEVVLTRTTGFDLSLVISEAFNIGIHTNKPIETAQLISKHLPSELQRTSYALLVRARLMLMGATQAEWDEGERLKKQGLSALKLEPTSTRWHEHSLGEIMELGLVQ